MGFQKILKKFDKYLYQTSSEVSSSAPPENPIANKSNNTTLSFYLTPDISDNAEGNFTRVINKNSHNRYSFTPIGKDLWALVLKHKFATSEADEILLSRARQLWRKRVPLSPAVTPLVEDLSALTIEDSSIPTINSLDLDVLPNGKVSMLWVVLAEDGLSLPIKVPVMVAKGVKDGPVVGLTAALHGNELNGIPLIHRLMSQDLNCNNLHGVVVSVPVANVPGYLAGQRTFSDGQDLNRVMPGKPNGSTSQVYAYNLIDRIVSKFTHLIDLHTASKGRANSLYVRANMNDPRTRRMAKLQNPQIIVHNTSPDGSLRGAAMERGIPAITVEIGDPSKFQKRFVKTALQGVTNILSNLKMVPDENQSPEYDPVVCARSYWIFAKRGGILNVIPDVNTWVKKNEIIATLDSVFGILVETYFAPEDGIVIGKEMYPVCQSGQRILHLGAVDDKFEAK
ncbi:7968_t:CDS:2 [Entrophospora sp. SA101]|nr:8184_t:CDS:2 [Entrophospora sp. SA101]CAJ0767507.1 3663_t:CDS:2 [Entrophospora sp. SA101]CAJ0768016.1 7968_t:CDS:2 [Entrophospora sp. SA101]CAJ0855916.1 9574_t:CDS:2 [Entrophospora sp. SA101]